MQRKDRSKETPPNAPFYCEKHNVIGREYFLKLLIEILIFRPVLKNIIKRLGDSSITHEYLTGLSLSPTSSRSAVILEAYL